MPLPTPKDSESKEKFVSRCMSEISKLPKHKDQKENQRLAICYAQYSGKQKESFANTIIDITKETVLPGTNIVLEKGDRVKLAFDEGLGRDQNFVLNGEVWTKWVLDGDTTYVKKIDATHFAIVYDLSNKGFPKAVQTSRPAIYHVAQWNNDPVNYASLIRWLRGGALNESRMQEKTKLDTLSSEERLDVEAPMFSSSFVEETFLPVVDRFVINFNNGLEANTAFSEACEDANLDGMKGINVMQRKAIAGFISDKYSMNVEYVY